MYIRVVPFTTLDLIAGWNICDDLNLGEFISVKGT